MSVVMELLEFIFVNEVIISVLFRLVSWIFFLKSVVVFVFVDG